MIRFLRRLSPTTQQENCGFGWDCTVVDTNTIAISAPFANNFNGIVYFFDKKGNLIKTKESDEVWGNFGYSIAANENLIAISSPKKNSVYLYDKNLNLINKIVLNKEIDGFGIYLHMDKNYIYIGNANYDKFEACVFVYSIQGNYITKIRQNIIESNSMFGSAIDSSNNFLLIADRNANSLSGKVFVYNKDFELLQVLENTKNSRSRFGTSLAITDKIIAIGAPAAAENTPNQDNNGAVFLYDINFKLQKVIDAVHTSKIFGFKLKIFENNLLISAIGSENFTGEAVIYNLETNSYIVVKPTDPTENSNFGRSIELDKDFYYVGANYINSATTATNGATYIYRNI